MAYEIFRTHLMLKLFIICLKFELNWESVCVLTTVVPAHFQDPVGFFLVAIWVGSVQSSNMHTRVSKGMQSRPFFRSRWGLRRERRGSDWYLPRASLLGVCLLPRPYLKHGLFYSPTN